MSQLAAAAGSLGIAAAITSVAQHFSRSLDPIRQPARIPGADPSGTVVPIGVAPNLERPRNRARVHRTGQRARTSRSPRTRHSDGPAPADAVLAEWCETLARRVRGGDSLVSALTQFQQPRLEHRRHRASARLLAEIAAAVVLATERGQRASSPLERYRGRSAGLDQALAVIRACLEIGGRAAFVLDRTAAGLRDRDSIAAERATNSAQAKMSALVLTLLPGLAMSSMVIGSPSVRAVLLGPIGWVCIPFGFGLNALGWWWMQRLVRS